MEKPTAVPKKLTAVAQIPPAYGGANFSLHHYGKACAGAKFTPGGEAADILNPWERIGGVFVVYKRGCSKPENAYNENPEHPKHPRPRTYITTQTCM